MAEKFLEIWYILRRPNLRIIWIERSEKFQVYGPENMFNKIFKEYFLNLSKEMFINIQEAFNTN